jgi:hypothetical protein
MEGVVSHAAGTPMLRGCHAVPSPKLWKLILCPPIGDSRSHQAQRIPNRRVITDSNESADTPQVAGTALPNESVRAGPKIERLRELVCGWI